jgi:CHAD domain-containing protein
VAEHLERELKLSVPSGFHLPELGGTELPDRSFVSTYHDTQDLRLARHGVTFRHRIENGSGLWQLKLPSGEARIELEEPGPPARPPERLLALLVALLRGSELVRVARLGTRRKSVRADGAEIVEDSVSVLDGRRVTRRFREVEVELLEGDERSLRRLEAALREAGAEPGTFEPKLFRVLELVYPPGPRHVPAGATPGEALGFALGQEHLRLLSHDPGTRLGKDPEDLHQMRVATRRARAFLRTARPILAEVWVEPLRAELRWLGSRLGRVRDLDVLCDRLRTESSRLDGEEEALALLETLESERDDAREAAVAELSDDRYFALLDRLEEGARRAPGQAGAGSLAELWWNDVRKARRTFARLGRNPDDSELHSARIRVKRARYAAELAAGELGDEGKRFVTSAKKLQDILGEHQDAVVAQERIARWAHDGGSGETADELSERERRRQAGARAAWPDAWKKVKRRARRARP